MKPWIETFTEAERFEYLNIVDNIRPYFRNGPIWGNVVSLIIEEIIDRRNVRAKWPIHTGPKPVVLETQSGCSKCHTLVCVCGFPKGTKPE